MAEILPLLILLPFAASLLCLLARFVRRLPLARIAAAGSMAGTMLVLGLLLPALGVRGELAYSMGGWPEPLGISLYLDRLR